MRAIWHYNIGHMAHSPKRQRTPPTGEDPSSYAGLLGLGATTSLALVKEVSRGFPYTTLANVRKATGLSSRELADAVNIRMRTVARRKERGRLDPDESDRLLRFARVFAAAVHLFGGDVPAARHWFAKERRAFGGQSALALAATEAGTREVETLIGRLLDGVLT
jgi:putative toxin-antitoxin system antitoxin component (TIGR02293 family)